MDVSPTPSSSAAGLGTGPLTGAIGGPSSDLGRNEFLMLLTTQLQNQDPLDPMANEEFVAQLAQFSSLEQQITTNETLSQVQLAQMSMANAQLAGLIGQEIEAAGDTLTIGTSGVEPVGLRLGAAAETVQVTIRDAGGNVVRTFERSRLSAGNHTLEWDGRDASGAPLPPGDYKVAIEAKGTSGGPIAATPLTRGIVTGITYENGYPELLVGDSRVLPADIISVRQPGAPADPQPNGSPGTAPTPTPPGTPPPALPLTGP
jgi:flagellar basal-body rod modification protein FlgD